MKQPTNSQMSQLKLNIEASTFVIDCTFEPDWPTRGEVNK